MQDLLSPIHAACSNNWPALLPFGAVLLCVATAPQVCPHLWESARHRALLLGVLALPACFSPSVQHAFVDIMTDYAAFIALIGALYVIAGGILIRGDCGGSPWRNTLALACGTLAASAVGTTGASMMLVRPLMAANRHRRHTHHLVVFFIVLVSNVGGLLLPIGDPPLFMGYLKGVPFFWTLRLWPMWLGASTLLLVLFFWVDSFFARRESAPVTFTKTPWHLGGRRNVVLLLGVVAFVASAPSFDLSPWTQTAVLILLGSLSYMGTPARIHRANQLSAAPLTEVSSVFAAIFITLPSALSFLEPFAPLTQNLSNTAMFWLTGASSSLLDNAPCYLTFAGLAAAAEGLDAEALGQLSQSVSGAHRLEAISAGAVMMGAMTYIGNGPNLMVRAVAQELGLGVPSFAGFVVWTLSTLWPILAVMHWLTS